MSQIDLIRQGQILKRKNKRLNAITDAKASLRSLANEAVNAQDKDVDHVNIEILRSHLDRLEEKKNESLALLAEIGELEY